MSCTVCSIIAVGNNALVVRSCNNEGMEGQQIKRVEYRFTLTPERDDNALLKSASQLKSLAKQVEQQHVIPNLVSADVYLNPGIGVTFVVVVDVDSWDTASAQSEAAVDELISKMGITVIDEEDPAELPEGDTVLNALGTSLVPA